MRVVLTAAAIGLAGALTAAASFVPRIGERAAPLATTYLPRDPSHVVATVAARDPADVARRRALADAPERVELAALLARGDIARYHAMSDPRYLGRAQATLARWWELSEPPVEVLLLRATIAQAIHQFASARADLDQLVRRQPDDPQSHLTRAIVATITADYAAARDSCRAVAQLASALVAATCTAPLDAIAGRADEAYARLAPLVAAPPQVRGGDARGRDAIRGWALTQLAELAAMRGDHERAIAHLGDALALDASDSYARNLLADLQLATGRAADASRQLAGRELIDSHLVRRAIAEHALGGPEAAHLIAAMRARIADAAARGDEVHLREEARFALAVDADPARAVRLARKNWEVQKELADARLLADAAIAARDRTAAAPVIAWATTTGVRDATLARALAQLAVLP